MFPEGMATGLSETGFDECERLKAPKRTRRERKPAPAGVSVTTTWFPKNLLRRTLRGRRTADGGLQSADMAAFHAPVYLADMRDHVWAWSQDS